MSDPCFMGVPELAGKIQIDFDPSISRGRGRR